MAGPIVVFERHRVEFLDEFFEGFGVDGVGVEGDPVEAALDPRHPVQRGEEVGGVHPPAAARRRLPKSPERTIFAPGSTPLIAWLEFITSLA